MQTDKCLLDKLMGQSKVDEYSVVIVAFMNDWNALCEIIALILDKISIEFEHQVFVKRVDVEKNKKIVKELKIHEIPTVLFFHGNQIVDHIIGVVNYFEFKKRVASILEGDNA